VEGKIILTGGGKEIGRGKPKRDYTGVKNEVGAPKSERTVSKKKKEAVPENDEEGAEKTLEPQPLKKKTCFWEGKRGEGVRSQKAKCPIPDDPYSVLPKRTEEE